MESDINALSVFNLIFKSADDTNLLVPENTDVSLSVEYDRCEQWADLNHSVINHNKTREIVFHLSRVRSLHLPPEDDSIERVSTAELLRVIVVPHVLNALYSWRKMRAL